MLVGVGGWWWVVGGGGGDTGSYARFWLKVFLGTWEKDTGEGTSLPDVLFNRWTHADSFQCTRLGALTTIPEWRGSFNGCKDRQ